MESNQKRQYITEILKQHEEFILIGLTGRVGSGCSEVAEIFSSSFEKIGLPPIYPGDLGIATDSERDRRILFRFAAHHWLKFDVIKVRAIITSFLLEDMDGFYNEIEKLYGNDSAKLLNSLFSDTKNRLMERQTSEEDIEKQLKLVRDVCACKVMRKTNEEDKEEKTVKEQNPAECGTGKEDAYSTIKGWIDYKAELSDYLNTDGSNPLNLTATQALFCDFYDLADEPNDYADRVKRLKEIDELLNMISSWSAFQWWGKKLEEPERTKNAFSVLSNIIKTLLSNSKPDNLGFFKYIFVCNIIPAISDTIHDLLSQNKGSTFTELYQKYGNSIRRFGHILYDQNDVDTKEKNKGYVFALPKRINQFIKSIRHPFSRAFAKPTRIVIDSLKSTFEATYLRERYSAFYLFAISAEENVRRNRLMNSAGKNLTSRDIQCIDWSEYSNYGADIYQRYLNERREGESNQHLIDRLEKEKRFSKDELEFLKKIEAIPPFLDFVRKEAYEKKLYQFVLQDVGSCIQNADVFISNNHTDRTKNMDLRWEIVRNISLIMHPGLLLPTEIERCMQAAFAAKANSGCLSRQVGAIVTDSEYNILSIGWNDVPCGDISCSRKNLVDIYREQDLGAYTEYEITNEDFRERITNIYTNIYFKTNRDIEHLLCGLPWRYCFKDIHTNGKHSMRSRAMHAEEKALANVQDKAEGGYLFTTSSPCEMCSKNAKNHRIKRIYYIEPYPGISEAQYSRSGKTENRAYHTLFVGAIGRAYTQMYTPVMPHKDILDFLGINNDTSRHSDNVVE